MLTKPRSYDLPDDVFSEDDVKPTRPAKKSKKRSAPEVCRPRGQALSWTFLFTTNYSNTNSCLDFTGCGRGNHQETADIGSSCGIILCEIAPGPRLLTFY